MPFLQYLCMHALLQRDEIVIRRYLIIAIGVFCFRTELGSSTMTFRIPDFSEGGGGTTHWLFVKPGLWTGLDW